MSGEAGGRGIALSGVTKRFGAVVAVNAVHLTVEEGEFMVLVGPSGCGKTTLLRMIAGLEDVTEGRIAIGGRDVTDVPPRDRDVAMVFQNYALYPHMTARENLGYGLRMRKIQKSEIRRRVEEVARMLGLEELLDRKPAQLSGGQRQRVAMGRAIAREPAAFLMDEPLSNLDAKLRVDMRAQLSRLHERLGVTTVYVTHDQIEAMTLGQRVAVMRDGRIQQAGEPRVLYREPANLFVAAFIGSPSMNLVEAAVDGDTVSFAGFTLPLDRDRRPRRAGSGRVIVGIRPESFEDAAFAERGLPQIEVEVGVLEDLGADAHVIFSIDAPRVDAVDLRAAQENDEAVLVDEGALFNARIDPRSSAQRGGRLRLALDPSRMHFFDTRTGDSLL
jgi:multiple sugar transport system ATP-binding protein